MENTQEKPNAVRLDDFAMSTAPYAVPGTSRYELWIADRDQDGAPIDPRLISAAYEIAPLLFKYRRAEIGCESVAATLIQASVNAASNAIRADDIENCAAYLLTVFTRKADRHLTRSQKQKNRQDDFLEDEVNRQSQPNALTKAIHNRLLCEQALEMMSPDIREVCELHYMQEVSMKKIAEMKGQTRNRLAVQLHRSLKRLAEELSSRHLNRRKSRG